MLNDPCQVQFGSFSIIGPCRHSAYVGVHNSRDNSSGRQREVSSRFPVPGSLFKRRIIIAEEPGWLNFYIFFDYRN